MRKITYTNSVNGLSAEFSSDNPLMHLDLKNFDGSSVGATSVTYKPVEFDGQRVISTNLSARTIILPIQFTAKVNGRYSRAAALDKWAEILKTFVPLHSGTLTWTDGTKSRRITCRTLETPQITEILPYLFSAQIQLVADYPYNEIYAQANSTYMRLQDGSGLEAYAPDGNVYLRTNQYHVWLNSTGIQIYMPSAAIAMGDGYISLTSSSSAIKVDSANGITIKQGDLSLKVNSNGLFVNDLRVLTEADITTGVETE